MRHQDPVKGPSRVCVREEGPGGRAGELCLHQGAPGTLSLGWVVVNANPAEMAGDWAGNSFGSDVYLGIQ